MQRARVCVHCACSMCKSPVSSESLPRVRRCAQPPTGGSRALAAKAEVLSRSSRGDSSRPTAFPFTLHQCPLHQCPVNALLCRYMMLQFGSSILTASTALGPMRAQSRTSMSISLLQQRGNVNGFRTQVTCRTSHVTHHTSHVTRHAWDHAVEGN